VDRCSECGFAYDLDEAESAGATIVAGVAPLAAILRDTPSGLAHRARPDTWSPLEYGCHTRDVLLVQRERVLAARRVDRPSFDPMGRDERVEHDGYAQQDPGAVARQVTDAAAMFALVLGRLEPADWDRRVLYNYPARMERSLRWVAVHTVHEVHHHLFDIRRQLGASHA
jgi:DinB superfamily